MNCRYCKKKLSKSFLNIGKSALANSFLKEKINHIKSDLKLFICQNCLLIQHSINLKSEKIFDEYSYFSSYSKDTLSHSKKFTKEISKFLVSSDNILEIACNDGYLLQYFDRRKYELYGVEPAKNVAKIAKKKGIKVFNNYFDLKFSNKLKNKKFKLIICNNVFAHIPNIKSFMLGLKNLINDETIVTIEVQYFLTLIRENLIDMIYHEHFYYHTIKSLRKIFSEMDLELFDCKIIDTHGGSLRIYISKKGIRKISHNLSSLIKKEDDYFFKIISKSSNFFQNKFLKYYSQTFKLLKKLTNKDKVIGFGAAAKCSTLINIFNINSEMIKFVIDDTPFKQGCYIPGSDIKVLSSKEAKKYEFDTVIIFAWNYLETIRKKIYKEFGYKKTMVLIPKLKILD